MFAKLFLKGLSLPSLLKPAFLNEGLSIESTLFWLRYRRFFKVISLATVATFWILSTPALASALSDQANSSYSIIPSAQALQQSHSAIRQWEGALITGYLKETR